MTSLRDALPVWAKIGILSFGGPAAQIGLMHRIVVDENRWLTEREYLNALSFCMLLPGPEAMQVATYCGWKMHGVRGGLTAGLLFVLPGAFVILALSMLYALVGAVPAWEAVFTGIKAAAMVMVFEALVKVSKKGLKARAHWIIAGLAFLALFAFALPFPLVVLAAGLYGLAMGGEADPANAPVTVKPTDTLRTILIWLAIWWLPIGALAFGPMPIFAEIGVFFSKLATVTFGGAYAVLAYMAQDAVHAKGWLSAPEMIDGLGLAETTPGPLILVTEFVGFLAGARADGALNLWFGTFAAVVTLWATFAPCFLWVFAGAPYIDWIASRHRLRAALAAITAAVVGVILNLSIWFAIHTLFTETSDLTVGWMQVLAPDVASLNPLAAMLALVAGILLLWMKHGVLLTLATCAVLGFLGGVLI
ncbi:chromate efflux transporter [Pseudoprimorskyibacter insulae]|uniref:Putative chromate transport protein n=1 Tax=Pseudoprimorskyibacter insulae TaxID=1695997 RepID=A0A2R8AUT5_9RHOB|nr:chromate efflux transporter [Pseudoprimorskyibacter insulae]SPF79687.1 putative chromate transport protein [Pseudoprimorskyibacter insulae]